MRVRRVVLLLLLPVLAVAGLWQLFGGASGGNPAYTPPPPSVGVARITMREIEEQVLLTLNVENHVISTGGSAVYGERAMAHLKSGGIAVFLDVTLETLEARVPDFSTRGLATGALGLCLGARGFLA